MAEWYEPETGRLLDWSCPFPQQSVFGLVLHTNAGWCSYCSPRQAEIRAAYIDHTARWGRRNFGYKGAVFHVAHTLSQWFGGSHVQYMGTAKYALDAVYANRKRHKNRGKNHVKPTSTKH